MGIKPSGSSPVVVPPDNVQSRWGAWEASIDVAGQQAGEVFAETHAIATSANSVAATALSEAREAIDASGAANDELESLLDPTNEDSKLWLLQWQVNENDRLALERHQEAIEANAADIATIRPHVTRALWLNLGVQSTENEYMRLYRGTASNGNPAVFWDIKSGWVGTFQIIGGIDLSDTYFSGKTFMYEYSVPNPLHPWFSSGSGIGSVLVTINVRPGTAHATPLPIPNQTLQSRGWETLQSWTIPQDTEVTANARLTFTNKTRIATYGLKILVDGQNVTTSSTAAMSPLVGHAPRVHSASMDVRRLRAGSVIELQAKADHSNSVNRNISNASFNVTWIDNTEAAE